MLWKIKSERLADDLLEAAKKQILDICGHLENPPDDRLFAAVHQARKRIKEVRALLRLTRELTGERFYQKQNRSLRAIARALAPMRDAAVLLATWQKLREALPGQITQKEFFIVAKKLSAKQRIQRGSTAKSRQQLKAKLESLLKSLDALPVKSISKKDLRAGLKQTRRQYQKEHRKATHSSTDENLHAWRKRVKDLTHQLDLVGNSVSKISKRAGKHTEQLRKLGKLLGDDQDLALFENAISKIDPGTGKKLRKPIKKKRAELRKAAFKLGTANYEVAGFRCN